MKCARCAHQWKLTPEDVIPDEETADSPVSASAQTNRQWQGQDEAAGAEDGPGYEEHAEASVDEEQWAPLQADEYGQMNQHGSAAYTDPANEDSEPPISEEEIAPSQGRGAGRQREHPSAEPDAGSGRAYPIPSGVYDMPSGIYENEAAPFEGEPPSDQPEPEETSAAVQSENWSSRFMGPGWRAQAASPPVEEEEDEDPESVIRETFRSVLEQTEDEEQAAAANLMEHAESSAPYVNIYDAEWNRTDNDDLGPEAFTGSGQDRAGLGENSDQDYFATEEALDDETSIYMRGEYGAGGPEAEEAYRSAPGQYKDEDFAAPGINERFAQRNGRPQPYDMDDGEIEDYGAEPNDYATPEASEDYAALYGDQFNDADDNFTAENGFDDTLIGLPEHGLQDTVDSGAYHSEQQNRSGLAVAAGWVAFMALMSGLLLGIVNFRQDVMAALPGTVNMYRMLGYEVELNKVDFASVDYKWSEIDGSPAIELRGEVVNITDSTVKVPPVLVNIQSASGAELKAEAPVPADELGPRDRTTFTLELVSPPEDVSRIELQFAPKG